MIDTRQCLAAGKKTLFIGYIVEFASRRAHGKNMVDDSRRVGSSTTRRDARHDFVPSYVICHGRGRDSNKETRTTFLLGKNGEREDIKKTYRYTTVKLNKV